MSLRTEGQQSEFRFEANGKGIRNNMESGIWNLVRAVGELTRAGRSAT
jgi:hypothetical protein